MEEALELKVEPKVSDEKIEKEILTGEKVTEFVIAGTENLYILYLRKKKDYWDKGDWRWCLKFEKRENDHCGSC